MDFFVFLCLFFFPVLYYLFPASKVFQDTQSDSGKTTTAPRLFSQLVFSSCSLLPVGSRTHTHMHPSASRCARWMVCRTIDQLSRHQRTDCQPTVRLYVRACNSSLYTNTNFSLSLNHSLSSHRAYGLPQFLGTLTRPFH